MAALHAGLGPGLLDVPTVESWSTPQQEVSTGVSRAQVRKFIFAF